MINKIRFWLIRVLAGKSSIGINLDLSVSKKIQVNESGGFMVDCVLDWSEHERAISTIKILRHNLAQAVRLVRHEKVLHSDHWYWKSDLIDFRFVDEWTKAFGNAYKEFKK